MAADNEFMFTINRAVELMSQMLLQIEFEFKHCGTILVAVVAVEHELNK